MPSPCPAAELLLALAPALQFSVSTGAFPGSPSLRGSQGHRAISLSPGLPEGQWLSSKGPDLQWGAQHQCSTGSKRSSLSKAASPKRRVSVCLVLTFAVPQQQDCLSPQSQSRWGSAHPGPPPPRQRPRQPQCAGGPYHLSALTVFPWEGGHKGRGRGQRRHEMPVQSQDPARTGAQSRGSSTLPVPWDRQSLC